MKITIPDWMIRNQNKPKVKEAKGKSRFWIYLALLVSLIIGGICLDSCSADNQQNKDSSTIEYKEHQEIKQPQQEETKTSSNLSQLSLEEQLAKNVSSITIITIIMMILMAIGQFVFRMRDL